MLPYALIPIAKPAGAKLARAENGGAAPKRKHYGHLRAIGWTPRMAQRYRRALYDVEVRLPKRLKKAVN